MSEENMLIVGLVIFYAMLAFLAIFGMLTLLVKEAEPEPRDDYAFITDQHKRLEKRMSALGFEHRSGE